METHWCGRCKQDVPMLTEDQFTELQATLTECIERVQGHREAHGLTLAEVDLAEFYRPLVEKHTALTGVELPERDAFRHHRRALFGPPCRGCGRLLRTARAERCVECGATIGAANR